jgi:hypothetical protein
MNKVIQKLNLFIFSISFLSLFSRAIFAISQFVATFFAVSFFTSENQALYFLFLSILSIQIIFELGLSQVLVILISGAQRSLNFQNSKLTDQAVEIIIFGVQRFLKISLSYFIITLIFAFFILYVINNNLHIYEWLPSWLLLLTIYTIRLFLILIESIIEGIGGIYTVLVGRIIYYLVFIFSFGLASYFGLELWSIGIAWAAAIMSGFAIHMSRHKKMFGYIYQKTAESFTEAGTDRVGAASTSSFYGKVSITWIASYAISNAPLLIAYTVANDKIVTSLGIAIQISAIIGVIAAAVSSPHVSSASHRHSTGDVTGFISQFKIIIRRVVAALFFTSLACLVAPIALQRCFSDQWPAAAPAGVELLPFLASAIIYAYMACIGQFFRATKREVFGYPLAASATITLAGMTFVASSEDLFLLGVAQLLSPLLIILPLTFFKHHQLIAQKDFMR